MIEVAQFLKNEAKRKSVESGFNIKLIENNEMIGKLFNGDKFPLLFELKEREEASNLLPKKLNEKYHNLRIILDNFDFYFCRVIK